jgi:hypothetical protein
VSIFTPEAPQIHGSEAVLVTGVDDTRGIQMALLRFMLPDVAGHDIAAARLEAYVASAPPRPQARITNVRLVETAWDEATTADDAMPSIGPVITGTHAEVGTWATWDVTAETRAWADGAPNHGLALTTADDLYYTRSFGSRESAYPPRLVLTLRGSVASPTPTPSASATAEDTATATAATPGLYLPALLDRRPDP